MKLHVILRVLIPILFITCFVFKAGQPPVADEVDFIKPIHAWVSDGPQREGLFHAPLYPWLESTLGRFFGVTPGVLRSIGLASVLVASGFLMAAAFAVQPLMPAWRVTLLLALVLLAPYALGSALLLDHDPTLLVVTTAFYFYLLARHETSRQGESAKTILRFGAALALCLMAKETTPLVYPAGLLVLLWPNLGFARAFSVATASALLGCALFAGVTALWCAIYKIPFAAVFEMDLLGLKVHGGEYQPWREMTLAQLAWLKAMPFLWLGAPLALLFFLRLPGLLAAGGAVRAIAVNVLLVLFAYTFVLRQTTYHFPKYMSPVLFWIPWLVLVPDRQGRGITNMSTENFRSWGVALLVWFGAFPHDPMRMFYEKSPRSALLTVVLLGVPTLVWALVRYLHLTTWSRGSPRPSTFACLLTVGLGLVYCRSVLIAPGSVTYWYGDNAVLEARKTIELWKARHPDGEVYAPGKDIAYWSRDLGAVYMQKEDLGNHAPEICAKQKPFLVVTRTREDSSFLRWGDYENLRKCMGPLRQGVDIVYASAYSRD